MSGALGYTNINTVQVGINLLPISFAQGISFGDYRWTNSTLRHSMISVAEGKVCKTPLQLVLVTNVNTFLAIGGSANLPVA